MACFSCNENKTENQVTILQMYKEAFETRGMITYFFQKVGSSNLQIMTKDDFVKFKKSNKKYFDRGDYEFSRIDEFNIVTNS